MLTSGMQKYVKMRQPRHVEPQMKNTFTCRPALPLPGFTRYGVAYEMAKFQSLRAGVGQPRRGARMHEGRTSWTRRPWTSPWRAR